MKTRKRVSRKIVEVKSPIHDRIPWSLYDEVDIMPNITIRDTMSLFGNPHGSIKADGTRRTLDETNLDLCCMLCVSNGV